MASIATTEGSLYFLGDKDYLTGKLGPYVKIGIVRYDKPTDTECKVIPSTLLQKRISMFFNLSSNNEVTQIRKLTPKKKKLLITIV